MATALVIENDPTNPVGRLGEWLTDAGLTLEVLRPHAGEALPEGLDGYAALVVMGGGQQAYGVGPRWFPALEKLLRRAVRDRVPTLGICLGGQLLATAHNGAVERSAAGPEIGPALVARRDAADTDPLWQRVPFLPDVFQWHVDEITELPPGAVLLATSTRYPVQAFRIGDLAWGTQFHIECNAEMLAGWAREDNGTLAELGIDPEELLAACDALLPEVEDVWQPFAYRFARLALGDVTDGPRRTLPLLNQ